MKQLLQCHDFFLGRHDKKIMALGTLDRMPMYLLRSYCDNHYYIIYQNLCLILGQTITYWNDNLNQKECDK